MLPLLRYKRFKTCTPLNPAVNMTGSGHRYLCYGLDDGLVEIQTPQDAEELLNPSGGRLTAWEIPWELLLDGRTNPATSASSNSANLDAQIVVAEQAVDEDPMPKRKPGRKRG